MMTHKRITLFVGHYGSGKTNIAVNYAKLLKKEGREVMIADLDIVNPYFRTKDSADELNECGIQLICSKYANSNVDIPALPSEIYTVTEDRSRYAVLDIGGDDRGAYALGRLTPAILEENDYEMLMVVNFMRPLTKTAEDVMEVIHEIETASGLKMTGLVNNTNLGNETDSDIITGSFSEMERLSRLSGLPIKFTSVKSNIEIDGIDTLKLILQKKDF